MKILRVLNTNAVLTVSTEGEEMVLLGVGIGFKRRPGDEVEPARIEKRFVLKNRQQQSRYQELLERIPKEYIMVAEQIISLGISLYDMKLNESLHISLPDHIYMAIDNFKQGITIPNELLLDLKQFYPNEAQIGLEGLQIIEQELGCKLPEDEAAFIAMHFINAQYGASANLRKNILFVKQVNDIVLKELNVTPDQNSLNYYRYMVHLKFFAQRVMTGYHYYDDTTGLLDSISLRFSREYACSQCVARFIQETYHYKVGPDELLYLTVHLTHLTRDL